jgi:hypothetical protein
MPCVEGDRLKDRFVEAIHAEYALVSQAPPEQLKEQIKRMQAVQRAAQFQKSCKSELMEHVRWCAECRPAGDLRSTMPGLYAGLDGPE